MPRKIVRMLERLLRACGRRRAQQQIEFDLHCRHYYWDEPNPLSPQQINEMARIAESHEYHESAKP